MNVPTSQAGSYRAALATRYWQTVRVVLENQGDAGCHVEPVAYLLGMSAELILKAYLTNCGVSDVDLSKKIGHDLRKCLRHSIQLGLRLTCDEARAVLSIWYAHHSHFTRYGPRADKGLLELGAIRLPNDEILLPKLACIIDRVTNDPIILRRYGSATIKWPTTLPVLQHCTEADLKIFEQVEQQEIDKVNAMNAEFQRKFGMKMMGTNKGK